MSLPPSDTFRSRMGVFWKRYLGAEAPVYRLSNSDEENEICH